MRLSPEKVNEIRCKYLNDRWLEIGEATYLAFISPCGTWINYIDPESGEKTHLNRQKAQQLGFYPSMNQRKAK